MQLDPEHARRLRRAEPARVEHPERDRHLPEDVAGLPLADHALHAVDAPDHLEPTLEDAEQRPRVTLVHGELARNERDVRHHPGEPVAFGRLEVREHCDPADLLRRHHGRHTGVLGHLTKTRWLVASGIALIFLGAFLFPLAANLTTENRPAPIEESRGDSGDGRRRLRSRGWDASTKST